MNMPASPWIGSTSIPMVFGPMAFSNALMSLYGMVTNPGVNGPKPLLESGSLEKPTIVVVLPWKLFSQTMISPSSSGISLTWWAYLRASLIDVSTASAPVFIGSAISMPLILQSFFRNGPILSFENALEVRVTRFICSTAALTILPWRWP